MKKILKGLVPLTVLSLVIGVGVEFIFNNQKSSYADNDYSITFDSDTNHFHYETEAKTDSTDDIKTASNQSVSFYYVNVIGQVDKSWHVLESNGCFQNTTRINGISNLTIEFKTFGLPFRIEWSKDANFHDAEKHSQTYTSAKSNYCSFDNYSPNYFRFVNTSGSYLNIQSMTLNFSCVIKYPIVEITNSNSDIGDIYSSIENGATEAGTLFRIAATGKNNHSFDGWYDPYSNERYSTDLILDLTVMNKDIFLEARYKKITDNKYQVFTLVTGNGIASGGGYYLPSISVSLISTPNEGYFSKGWFYPNDTQDENMKNPTYTFQMPSSDLCFATKFGKSYRITYSSSPSEGGVISGREIVNEGEEVTLTASPNFDNEYAFNLWRNIDFDELSKDNVYTFIMPDHDLNLVAEFKKGIKLNLISSNDSYGTVTGSGYYLKGRNVKIEATPLKDCVFKGWYSDSEYLDLLTTESSYTFSFPSFEISFYALFLTKEQEEWDARHGVIPVISEDGKTLTYGLYPQSHVNDPSLITELEKIAPKADEEYFMYNNEYYVKDTGNPCLENYTFSDDSKIIFGDTYFFKCEPITWKIILSNDNYIIDCSNILYAHRFDDETNVYKDSELETWLNNNFFDKAFSIKNTSSYIVPTDLSDVSVLGDKVWVGSINQYDGGWYSSNLTRQKKVSDFALCNYAFMSTETSYFRNGGYWSRSCDTEDWESVFRVGPDGGLSASDFDFSNRGCSPSLTITIISHE